MYVYRVYIYTISTSYFRILQEARGTTWTSTTGAKKNHPLEFNHHFFKHASIGKERETKGKKNKTIKCGYYICLFISTDITVYIQYLTYSAN